MREGIISLITRFTPESFHPHFGFGTRLKLLRNGNKKSNCKIPATKTPIASARPGLSKLGANKTADRIKTIFNMTGLNAVAQKCFFVFKTAPHHAVSDMKKRYGKVNLSISTDSS